MTLDTLLLDPATPTPGEASRLWEGTILETPATFGVGVMVALPGADNAQHAHGPCRYTPVAGSLPRKGDRCLVAFDDEGDPWVVSWSSLFSSAAGPAVEGISDYLATLSTDDRSEPMVHGVRRAIEVRIPFDAVRIAGAIEDYIGQVDAIEDPTGDAIDPEGQLEASATKRFNSTAAGFSLQAQSLCALHGPGSVGRLAVDRADEIARTLLCYQYATAGTLRRGGFRLTPTDSRATAFGTGVCGRAMLYFHQVTDNSAWLASARSAADFLLRLANPNDHWSTYGVSPIVNPAGAICDRVDGADKISTTSSTLNLVAAAFLMEMADHVGSDTPEAAAISGPYRDAAIAARDFMAKGVLEGYDFLAVRTNIAAGTLAEDIDTSETVFDIVEDGPVALPGAYPYDLALAGETVTVTGSPGAGQLTVTRSTSPVAHGIGDRWEKVETYVTARWPNVSSHMWNDDLWHRLGDLAKTGTHGTDGTEYGIQALYQMGFPVQPLRDRYEYLADLIFVESGTFQDAYNAGLRGRICYPGYFRLGNPVNAPGPDRPYGTYRDSQGAMTLAEFKSAEFPADFLASLPVLLEAIHHGSLLNENGDTVFSDAPTYRRATKGALPIAQAGIGLLRALR